MVLLAVDANAQLFDTIAASFNYKPKFDFKFATRNSFIASKKANIFAFKIGLEFNETVTVGLGFNSLKSSDFYENKIRFDENGMIKDTVKSILKFNYISPFFEYIFFKNKRWEHTINIQVGLGKSKYEYTNLKGNLIKENEHFIFLYEPSMSTEFKICPWLGVGCGVGYRVLLIKNFTSPIYSLGIKLHLGYLYRKAFPKKENQKKSAP